MYCVSCNKWAPAFGLLILMGASSRAGDVKSAPVKVKIETEKEERFEADAPVDPTVKIQFRAIAGGTMNLFINDEMGRRLQLNQFPTFKVDGLAFVPSLGAVGGGRFEVMNGPLPKKGPKDRQGYMNVFVTDDIRITQTVELTAGKSYDMPKRQLNAILVRYLVENKSKMSKSVGLRTCIDSWVIDMRNCKFAAPTKPGELLDGIEFKDRDVPPYVQTLQRPDIKNPGTVVYITFGVGSGAEKPSRLVLTGTLGRRDLWDLTVMPGGFNSIAGFFWDPKEIKPGGKREFVYGFGTGLASNLATDTNFKIDLSGSFEIGKTFTISALVADPGEGQSLELDLPKGLERVEGKLIQPVPVAVGDTSASVVMWKGRVLEYGRYPIRIRSSAGVTKTTTVTIGPG